MAGITSTLRRIIFRAAGSTSLALTALNISRAKEGSIEACVNAARAGGSATDPSGRSHHGFPDSPDKDASSSAFWCNVETTLVLACDHRANCSITMTTIWAAAKHINIST